MTMRLTIKNEDAARVAQVSVQDRDVISGDVRTVQTATIYAGQEQTFYIHAARRLTVTEAADASIPAPVQQEG